MKKFYNLGARPLDKGVLSYFSTKNICCGCSKETSHQDSSFECPKQMLKLMDKKIITLLRRKKIAYLNLWYTGKSLI